MMSSTPKVSSLSFKQLNKTLSAKKKNLKTIKNVLSSDTCNWQVVNNPQPIYDEIMSVIQKISSKESAKNSMRNYTVCGVNQIGKHIIKEKTDAILFDADTPPTLISPVMRTAQAKDIPSVLVPGLRLFLSNSLGFKSSSVCFKSGDEKFYKEYMLFGVNEIGRYVKEGRPDAILFDAAIPRMLISHLMQTAQTNSIPALLIPGLRLFLLNKLGFKSSSLCFKSSPTKCLKLSELVKSNCKIDNKSDSIKREHIGDEVMNVDEKRNVVYLRRPENGKRAFNPPPSKNRTQEPQAKGMDYIQLHSADSKTSIQKQKSIPFKPLIVKQIQSKGKKKKRV